MVSMPKPAKEVDSIDDIGGRDRPAAGFYHAAIIKWDETMKEKDQIVMTLQILGGTTPGQEGKTLTDYNDMKRHDGSDNLANFYAKLRRTFVAADLMNLNDEFEGDATDLIKMRQFIVEITEEPAKSDKNKTYVKIGNYGNAIWPIGHEAVAHVPLNQAALKLPGAQPIKGNIKLPGAGGTQQQNAQQQQQPNNQAPNNSQAGGGNAQGGSEWEV